MTLEQADKIHDHVENWDYPTVELKVVVKTGLVVEDPENYVVHGKSPVEKVDVAYNALLDVY